MSIFFCKNGVWQIYDVCRYPNIYYRTKYKSSLKISNVPIAYLKGALMLPDLFILYVPFFFQSGQAHKRLRRRYGRDTV